MCRRADSPPGVRHARRDAQGKKPPFAGDRSRRQRQADRVSAPAALGASLRLWLDPIPIAQISNRGANGSDPTVLLMGGNHGDEYEGQVALGRLIRELEPGEVQGPSSCPRRTSPPRWPAAAPRRWTKAISTAAFPAARPAARPRRPRIT